MNCHAVVSRKLICIGQVELTPERVVVVGRHLGWLTAHRKLCFGVAGGLHVGELV